MSAMGEIKAHPNGRDLAGLAAGLDDASTPSAARIKDLKPHQQELLELYRKVRQVEGPVPLPNPNIVRGDLVGTHGALHRSFLLPNGEHLGKPLGIGLPAPCTNPKLHELVYSREDKGFWLRLSGEDKHGTRKETWVLVREDRSGADAITSYAPHQKELFELYREAKKVARAVPFPNPDTVRSDLVHPQGPLKTSFFLPNGEELGKPVCIGLPSPCTSPKFHELVYSEEDKGFWLRMSGQDQHGTRKETWMLVLEETSGVDAIRSYAPHQKELLQLYRQAKKGKGTIPFPNPDTVGSDLVGGNGRLQESLFLPNGERLGKKLGIGLPSPCTNPKLHELIYSAEDKGFWLRFSGEDKHGTTRETWVLALEDRSGVDAVRSYAPHQKELLELYRAARKVAGAIPFPNPDTVRSDLVGPQGGLQMSLLLPNGEQLGKHWGIALPSPCLDPKFHEIRYSAEERGFWIKASSVNLKGRTKVVEFLVAEDPAAYGGDAILRKRALGQGFHDSSELPAECGNLVPGYLH